MEESVMSKPIYQIICDNIVDSHLPEDFSLENPEDTDKFTWAPGALDGVTLYHMGPEDMSAAGTKELAQALRCASRGSAAEAEKKFCTWSEMHRAIASVDTIQNYVIRHQRQLDPTRIHSTAVHMILHSENAECVKIGLVLIELFTEPEEKLKEIIRRLGLYDEFTIFAVWNMQKWEGGNEEIFRLARETHSWGRIHAVERLEPETNEIRRWLLTEGTVNSVVNAYSSLTCWQKSGAQELLFGAISYEEYQAIAVLIEGLLDEEPVPGISECENPKEILVQFLSQSHNFELSWEDYSTIYEIKLWAEDDENDASNLLAECKTLLQSETCKNVIAEAVKIGRALNLAKALSIPFESDLFAYMQSNFEDSFYNCRYLMSSEEYPEAVLALFREKLPLDQMTGEPTEAFPHGPDFAVYSQLDFLLQELNDAPMTGDDFVMTALHSPYIRGRNRALYVLQNWVETTQQPLEELSEEFWNAVKELESKEVNEGAQKMIATLLSGATQFCSPFRAP